MKKSFQKANRSFLVFVFVCVGGLGFAGGEFDGALPRGYGPLRLLMESSEFFSTTQVQLNRCVTCVEDEQVGEWRLSSQGSYVLWQSSQSDGKALPGGIVPSKVYCAFFRGKMYQITLKTISERPVVVKNFLQKLFLSKGEAKISPDGLTRISWEDQNTVVWLVFLTASGEKSGGIGPEIIFFDKQLWHERNSLIEPSGP